MKRLKLPKSLNLDLRNSLRKTLKQTSVAAVLVAVIGYYFTYQDRIDTRQQNAWSVIRTALEWSENKKWGNVGQIQAVETLTRDCDSWWLNTPLKYLFGRDCVELKSLSLMSMDFGGLDAPGATLSYGFFACSNFAAARLRRARLDHTSLMASNLAGADLSGQICEMPVYSWLTSRERHLMKRRNSTLTICSRHALKSKTVNAKISIPGATQS